MPHCPRVHLRVPSEIRGLVSLSRGEKAHREAALAGVDGSEAHFLFPGSDGQPLKKYQVVRLIERMLQAAGLETTRADEAGRQIPRFGGHTLRVSLTQHLAALNVPLAQIQLQDAGVQGP